jgi:hypothetical protein
VRNELTRGKLNFIFEKVEDHVAKKRVARKEGIESF